VCGASDGTTQHIKALMYCLNFVTSRAQFVSNVNVDNKAFNELTFIELLTNQLAGTAKPPPQRAIALVSYLY
jgi:hypothetical protein